MSASLCTPVTPDRGGDWCQVELEKPVESGDAAAPLQLLRHCWRGRENAIGAAQPAVTSSPASTRCPPSCTTTATSACRNQGVVNSCCEFIFRGALNYMTPQQNLKSCWKHEHRNTTINNKEVEFEKVNKGSTNGCRSWKVTCWQARSTAARSGAAPLASMT